MTLKSDIITDCLNCFQALCITSAEFSSTLTLKIKNKLTIDENIILVAVLYSFWRKKILFFEMVCEVVQHLISSFT